MFIPSPASVRRVFLTSALLTSLAALPACWSSAPTRLTGADVPSATFLSHLDQGDLDTITIYGDGTLVAAARAGRTLPSSRIRTRATLDIPTWDRLLQSSQKTQTPIIFDQEQ